MSKFHSLLATAASMVVRPALTIDERVHRAPIASVVPRMRRTSTLNGGAN